jgi:serine/threonine protein kinase
VESVKLLEKTESALGNSGRQANSEPIPGYRLVERLGSGGFGEVWKCEAPGGLFKAIKFVYGNLEGLDGASAEEELRAIQHVKAIRHPFMLSMERVEIIDGELVIVMELADNSLADLLAANRQKGAAGIPRLELLGYLREAAEALDLMNIQHGLQHLDIKPHNLFLVSGHLKVADFGLVNSLGAGRDGNLSLSAITPVYASPEVFRGSLSGHCDQYSLAIVYQELLTGSLPFNGKNARQLLLQHTTAEPDVGALPESDRSIVGKALAKEPQDRFATCTDFILALSMSQLTEAREEGRPAGAAANRGAVAGHRLIECVGCSPQAETWNAIGPDEKKRTIKFLFGLNWGDRKRADETIARLNAIRYPTLAYFEAQQQGPGRLALIADRLDRSVWKRFQDCQANGLPGIPRDELLALLRIAAESLDHLYEQHGIEHLALNPRNLFLDGNQLLIDSFGLMPLLYVPAGQPLPQAQKAYAAPELINNRPGRGCDQYSLALIFCDLLGGTSPRRAQSSKRPLPRLVAKRDLNRLPAADREIIVRALCDDPQKRWTNSTEMVRALQEATPAALAGSPDSASGAPEQKQVTAQAPSPAKSDGTPTEQLLNGLLASAGQQMAIADAPPEMENVTSAGEMLLRKFTAPLPIGSARLKLDEFCQQCGARVIETDEEHVILHVVRPRSFWQQCMGRQPGLELRVHFARPRTAAATPIDVTLQISSFGCSRKKGAQLLEEMGALLLESIRTVLQVTSERRMQDRLLWQQTLPVRSVLADGSLGELLDCQGKDISVNGVGFYVSRPLPTTLISIDVPTQAQPPTITVRANIVRVQRCGNGWYEVGALFLKRDGQE